MAFPLRDTPLQGSHETFAGARFIGRQQELAALEHVYEASQRGYARVAVVEGEPGIGKTRLLNEFSLHVVQEGAVVLHGGAFASEGMPPYLPFLKALGQYVRVAPLDELRFHCRHAPHVLADILPELRTRLGDLPAALPLPMEQMRMRLYEAIGIFLESLSASQGLVFALDDLHWADSASLDLLCHMTRYYWKARVLFVCTYRTNELAHSPVLERTLAELTRQRVLTTATLPPLDPLEVEEMATSYLGGPLDVALSELLATESEGNAFFVEELLRYWLKERAIVQQDTAWVIDNPIERLLLPPGIMRTLRQRFERFSPQTIDHLRMAAVIGRTFDLSLLAQVEDQGVELIEEQLLEAVRGHLLEVVQPGVFTFHHKKICESLYTQVTTSRRRRLHEMIGSVLESRYRPHSTSNLRHFGELALHFSRHTDATRKHAYVQRHVEQAQSTSPLEKAMKHYRKALDYLEPDDEQGGGGLHLKFAEAALFAGAHHEAVTACEAVLSLLSPAGKPEVASHASRLLGYAHWQLENLHEAKKAFERALFLQGNVPHVDTVQVLADLTVLLTAFMGLHTEGSAYAQQAAEMATHLGDNGVQALATRVAATRLYIAGEELASYLPLLERALSLAEAANDASETAACLSQLSCVYYWTAQTSLAYDTSLRKIEYMKHSQSIRRSNVLHDTYCWLALLRASQGKWVEAEQLLTQAASLPEKHHRHGHASFFQYATGFLAYQREEYREAEEAFQQVAVYQPKGQIGHLLRTNLLGLAQIAQGKKMEARSYSQMVEGLLVTMPEGSLPTAPLLMCLALIAVASNDKKQVPRLYERLLVFRGQHYWFLVDRALGALSLLSGNVEQAAIHLEEAQVIAEREEMFPELGRLLLDRAELALVQKDKESMVHAKAFLNQALILFEELHMMRSVSYVRSRQRVLSYQKKHAPRPAFPANLTYREVKVLQLVADGLSNRQIARELGLSEKTIANHLSHIFSKTMCENRAAATAFAMRHGLV